MGETSAIGGVSVNETLVPVGSALLIGFLFAVLFTGYALYFCRGWVERGVWSPRWLVVVSGLANFLAIFVWLRLLEGSSVFSAMAFGAFVQYAVLASASDARSWLIAKEITWPPVLVGFGSLIYFSYSIVQGVVPQTVAGGVVFAVVVLVAAVAGWFFYGTAGLFTAPLGVWAGFLFLQAGLLGGLLLLFMAALFSVRSGFGMGFGDVRMAGVAAATLWIVPVDFVLLGLVLFVVSTIIWASVDARKGVEGKSWLHRKVPLAPTFCLSMVAGASFFAFVAGAS